MQNLHFFLSNKDNVYITLFLSSFQNLLMRQINEFKINNENVEFSYQYRFLNDLVYDFFSDYTNCDYDYEQFNSMLDSYITDNDLEIIDKFVDYFLSYDESHENIPHYFLGHSFCFRDNCTNYINLKDKATLSWIYDDLEILNYLDYKIDSKITKIMYKHLIWYEYTYKYSIIRLFNKKRLSLDQIVERWLKLIFKATRKFVNKFRLRKYFKNNPVLKWLWACRFLCLVHYDWVEILDPNNYYRLHEYHNNRRIRDLAALAVIL